ncbi:MAG TPA: methylenetetrahydrofolate reductase [NAD(P)H] [Phycisphaerales bacterium]|nr:methylenetetrahydrofolate reductase [NAD(P)H] [Phycisphaerales bacterium]
MSNLYAQSTEPIFSCEFFPPRSEEAQASLERELPKLMSLPFQLATCTNGACGSDRSGTAETLRKIGQEGAVTLAAHLCCRGSTPDELKSTVNHLKDAGARWIVALRGDRESPRGFQHADQLVSLLNEEYPELGVVVAGYPETHPESETAQSDLIFLKQKIDSGAHAVYTQFFFENSVFLRYRDRCAKIGIDTPIIPGILPIKSLRQVERLVERCGANLTDDLKKHLSEAEDEAEAGFQFTLNLVRGLLEEGVAGLHFYALNEATFVTRLFEELGLVRDSAHSCLA